jgi:predicted DsbA family dithiol-disulfide isomerase
LKIKVTHFPLHPDTPEEGRSVADRFRGRDLSGRNTGMKARMDEEGLPYNSERTMSYNSRLAQELAKWAESKGKGDEIHNPIFRAYFVGTKNIAKLDVLVEIAEQAGLPSDEAVDVLVSRPYKDAVDADWRRCGELGITGVPTFLVDRYVLVGAHPYEELEKLVQRAS